MTGLSMCPSMWVNQELNHIKYKTATAYEPTYVTIKGRKSHPRMYFCRVTSSALPVSNNMIPAYPQVPMMTMCPVCALLIGAHIRDAGL